jgi:thiamine-monophosphate kinase
LTSEFDIIAKYFAPLSADFDGAFNLTDDAASLPALDAVITKDVLVEGVHFRAKDQRSLVARKALRVNLSDLAAKGARPIGYFLGCVWPLGVKEEAIADFASGLREDQDLFKIALIGGDTTMHALKGAPLTISVTMVGARGPAGVIRRSGAASGDDVYVSGTIGDAGLGLGILSGDIKVSAAHKAYLTDRYQLPAPRVSLGGALGGHASASIDVSDGLIADASHIANQSSVAIDLFTDKIPLSEAASAWLEKEEDRDAAFADIASFGDDYEILFTAPASRRRSIEMASQVTKTPVARIGSVAKGKGVRLLNADGAAIEVGAGGFDHFRK